VGGTWVTFSQALWYQRVFASPSDEVATRAFFNTRADLGRLPFGAGTVVSQGTQLPASGAPGEVFVVGDCDGVYVSDGAVLDELAPTNWKPIVRTPAVGAFDVDVTFPAAKPGTADPVLVGGTAADPYVLRVEHLGDGNIRFRDDRGSDDGTAPIVHVTPGRTYRMRVAADPQTHLSEVLLDDRKVFSGSYLGTSYSGTAPHLGVNDVDTSTAPKFRGTLDPHPASTALCRKLLDG